MARYKHIDTSPRFLAVDLHSLNFELRSWRSQPLSNARLCGTLKWNLPAGKHEYGGMALECMSKNLRALDTQINSAVFDG